MALRNIGILAHVDAGKTTLSERICYFCHAISRMGEVSDGTTVMDFMPEEQQRGITIGAACISCTWKDTRINLVDTPGHIDFTFEVDRMVRVLDGAVVVFSAVDGVEPQSEMVWHQADAHHLPRLIFLNKVDRTEADTDAVLAEIHSKLRVTPLVLTRPLYANDAARTLLGIVDIVRLEALYFDSASFGEIYTRKPLFGAERDKALAFQDALFDDLATVDETFLAAWVEGHWTEQDVLAAITRATRAGLLVPVYCGSAKRNTGVQCLLDGIVTFLPPPTIPQKNSETVGLVFKVVFHGDTRIAWIRLYRGQLRSGDLLTTSSHPSRQATIRLYRIDAEQIIAVDHADTGDIVAVAGLLAQTGDTVTTSGVTAHLEPLPQSAPVVFQTIEPNTDAAYAPLLEALERYRIEDPSLHIEQTESGAYMLSGMGELHLQVVLERLQREYHLAVRAQRPSVVVRETIVQKGVATATFPPPGGTMTVSVAPRSKGSGNAWHCLCADSPFRTSVEQAIARVLDRGLNFGPLIDTEVEITVESIPATDDLFAVEHTCEITLTEALTKAKILRVEPIMHLAVTCTDESMGSCLQEIQRVQGTIVGVEEAAFHKVIHAEAALADIRDLPTRVRSAAHGRASILTTFARFDHKARTSDD